MVILMAVHGKKMPKPETALDIVRELSHVFYWTGRTYLRKGAETRHPRPRKGLLTLALELASPPEQQIRSDADIACHLAHARARLTDQPDRLTFKLLAVLPSLCHDTPPGPRWAFSEVSALAG